MKKIESLEKLKFIDWSNITIDKVNITKKWGKTYFYVKNNSLYYENLSWPKRIFFRIFFSKKVEKDKKDLWEYLKIHKKISCEFPKKNFRINLSKVLLVQIINFNLQAIPNNSSSGNIIDFSKIKPSTIFKLFFKGFQAHYEYGDVAISGGDSISHLFRNYNFIPDYTYYYAMNIVIKAKNLDPYPSVVQKFFTMNESGNVEYQGKIYNNFDEFISQFKTITFPNRRETYTFPEFNFYTPDKSRKLRKILK